jgi:large subunit ribosomal protein L9
VKPGFARNYLLPQGIALPATDGNLRHFQQLRRTIDREHERKRTEAEAVAKRLEGVRVIILKRVDENDNLYGSVTATEIAEALAEQGIEIDRRRIDLEGGIKSMGDHEVRIELHSEVTAPILVTVDRQE